MAKAANSKEKAFENALKQARLALVGALADPAPRPLMGTKSNPGIFMGSSQAAKDAAKLVLVKKWIRATGEFTGNGKSKKELHQITAAGIEEAVQNSETATLLREMTEALERGDDRLHSVETALVQTQQMLAEQRGALEAIIRKVHPPDLKQTLDAIQSNGTNGETTSNESMTPSVDNGDKSSAEKYPWRQVALQYLKQYRERHRHGSCTLPELYEKTAEPLGLSIGEFHDEIRQLARDGVIRLQPFTGAAYQLENEQYALLAGQEIKYYIELLEPQASGIRG